MFNIQQDALCSSIFSDKSSPYTLGCIGINGAPKHALNVALGSVTPISVPATLAVYPDMKWYAACFGFSLAIGGSTPNASQVRKTTL